MKLTTAGMAYEARVDDFGDLRAMFRLFEAGSYGLGSDHRIAHHRPSRFTLFRPSNL